MNSRDPDRSSAASPERENVPERIDVAALLKNAREVVLIHDGQDYRLRVTAKGKLILTK